MTKVHSKRGNHMRRLSAFFLIILLSIIGFISSAFTEEYNLTKVPIITNNDQEILFGDWPQSIKDDDITITEDITYNINGFTCYKGSDNYYYVKVEAEQSEQRNR